MEGKVIVIIKAANQSSPDQRVECDARWSVLSLKTHLADTHPARPTTAEQRLIYSGQLLSDHLLLCNVLRRPSEENAYTIHLVCTPPPVTVGGGGASGAASRGVPPSTTRQANPPSSNMADNPPSSSNQEQPQMNVDLGTELRRRHPPTTPPTIMDPPSFLPVGGVGGQPSADPIHQMAAMQQLYAHYMAYVQYMQMGGGVGGLPWPQQMMQIPPPPNPATTTTASEAEQTPAPAPQADDPVPQPQPQPQQPIRMNAQGGEVDDDDDEGAARDWLDWVYMMSRMLVLLFIVYFYSTLSRFMMVVFIAMLLYLYQAGWFRPTRRAEPPPPQPQDNVEPMEEEEDEEEEEEEERREEVQVVRPSLLSLSWTFLTAFFTSLIPEQPQGI